MTNKKVRLFRGVCYKVNKKTHRALKVLLEQIFVQKNK